MPSWNEVEEVSEAKEVKEAPYEISILSATIPPK